MKEKGASRLPIIISMVIFGTIGIFRRHIDLSSSVLALLRGVVGTAFLFALMRLRGQKADMGGIKRNLPVLALSGALIGFNWILLFEAYRYTTVATATLCYYMAPIFVILCSPILLKERLSSKKLLCVGTALAGMVLVSGVLQAGFGGAAELTGVFLGLGAAVLYASVILLNKRIDGLGANDRTMVQLFAAAIVLVPYTLLTGELTIGALLALDAMGLLMLMVVCIVHTGAAYAMYFGAMKVLPAQTVALLSYIDPVVAIVLSALLLGEKMGVPAMIGAVLVLGAAVVSELPERKK